jgi:cation:H+ antiporter
LALTVLALVAGLALLTYAADQFVLGAARVALIRNIPSLVVGVVIIGFGTSLPELLVSSFAARGGNPEIAIGNIVGSNLANLSLLLGVGALIIPLRVDSRTVRNEGPLTIAAMIAFAVAVQGGGINRIEGVLLLALMGGALAIVGRRSNDDSLGDEAAELADPSAHRLPVELARAILGMVGTIAGAQLLLWGAVDVAERAGLAQGFVGVTLVAIGTSLPELVTVIQSARRSETDLIIGNLLGSNLFNALSVGGVVGLIGTGTVDDPQLTTVAALGAIGVVTLAVITMRTGSRVSRREGALLVVVYAAIVPFLK